MSDWFLVKTITNLDGTSKLEIWQKPPGIFQSVSSRWMPAGEEDEGALGDGFWTNHRESGLFDSLEACAQEAEVMNPWLRNRRP